MKERNKNLCLLIVLVLLSIGGGVFFLFKNASQEDDEVINPLRKEDGYFVLLKILGYAPGNIPYLKVIIGDKTIPAKIDLGYNGMVSLPSDLIKDIDEKKWIERTQSWGLRGRIHEKDVYRMKKIKIEDMSFFPIEIDEESLESIHEGALVEPSNPTKIQFGTIGWELFSKGNLLVDCKHSFLALCDSIETLKKQGYPVDSFTEAKLLSNSGFIAFEALTEAGPLSCMLDTGCTSNLLNKDLANGDNDHRILTSQDSSLLSSLNPENKDLLIYDHEDTQELSSFKIEGKEFGPLTFYRIKSPIPIDVVLGMEFLDSTLVFIDFENEKVYLFSYTGEDGVTIGAGHERKN